MPPASGPPRSRWKWSRCSRECNEPVRHGSGPAWSACSCGEIVNLEVRRELDGRVVSVIPLERPAVR